MKFIIFRLIAVAYCVMFILYFVFRAVYSIGNKVLWWRLFVLLVEFLSSVSVFFVVIMKIRYPWTEYVGQVDGTMMKAELERDQDQQATSTDPDKVTENDAVNALQADLDDELVSTPLSRLVGPAGLDIEMERKENNQSEIGASERLDDDEYYEDDDESTASGKRVSMAALRVGIPKAPTQYLPYVVRVLVPCYREGLDIVQPTLLAALKMEHDPEKLHVYLCDDGKDAAKESWIESMRSQYPNLHYVTRPAEFKGHGKAGNLNYCLREVIYKNVLSHNENIAKENGEEGKKKRKKFINRKEVVAIFDADMVARTSFLTQLLKYFAKNRRCVMVQSPQTFHNVPMDADFFDAHNINFFQYMLPSFGAWNTTTCCGTNFLVAARALQSVNFFPTISVTEDMYLAMLLLAAGGVIEYHSENLVIGEAPQDLRQIFQQRSRWAKGTIQIFYKDNPLFKKGLHWMARLSFFNACWSYFTSAFFNPLFVFINAAGILFGIFPVADLAFGTSLLFVCYYGLFYAIILATPVPHKHFVGLWVVGKMGHFFSFMSLKAIWNITLSMFNVKKNVTFKVTNKKAKIGQPQKEERSDRDSSHRDIVFHWIMCTFIVLTIIYGIYVISGGTNFLEIGVQDERNVYQRKGIQVFMTFWMVQFFISYSLPLWYAYLPQDFSIQASALKYLSLLDSFLSVALVVLTALLFKVPFMIALPQLSSITSFPPNTKAFWVNSVNDLGTVGGYIYDSALAGYIPTVVLYMRPDRDEGLMSAGGMSDWVSYRSAISSFASTLKTKAFYTAVILEPDWMYEAMYIANSSSDPNAYAILTDNLAQDWATSGVTFGNSSVPSSTQILAWDEKKWYKAVNSFVEFASSLPSYIHLYIDAGNPYYHQVMKGVPLAVLNHSLYDKSVSFRGVSFNVANFYSSDDVMTLGSEVYSKYGWYFVEDSSRNGGTFSSRSMKEIDSCKFDPPYVDSGEEPSWFIDTETATSSGSPIVGLDAKLWIKTLGEADGRMYTAGETHTCLINHEVECSARCPEVPYKDPITGKYTWPSACKCD